MSPLVCIFKVSIYLQRSREFKERETGKNNGEMERRKEGREESGQEAGETGKRKENAEKSQQNQMIQKLVPSPDQ